MKLTIDYEIEVVCDVCGKSLGTSVNRRGELEVEFCPACREDIEREAEEKSK